MPATATKINATILLPEAPFDPDVVYVEGFVEGPEGLK